MQSEFLIGVDEAGNIQFPTGCGAEELFDETPLSTTRASHVEPSTAPARLWFRFLRTVFGDKGKVANWTREWHCRWRVDMRPSGGPILPTAWKSRDAALRVELAWLEDNYL